MKTIYIIITSLLVLFIVGCSGDCAVNNQEFQTAAKQVLDDYNRVATEKDNLQIQLEECQSETKECNATKLSIGDLTEKCKDVGIEFNQTCDYTTYIQRVDYYEKQLEDCMFNETDCECDCDDMLEDCEDDVDYYKNKWENCDEDLDDCQEQLDECESDLENCETDLDEC